MTEASQAPKDLIGFLDFYLVKKAPFQLPDTAKEAIVKWAPWIAVVLLVISLPPLLLVLGLGAVLVPFSMGYGPGYAATFTYLTLVIIVELALDVAALPGLFARKMSGWRLIFYARLISIVYSLLIGAIVGAVVGGLISLYILFQVRPLYADSLAKTSRASV